MSFRHVWAMTRKEFDHIVRDRSTLILVLFTPTLILLLMAYALTVDLKNIPIAVLDFDRTQASQAFIQQITAGQALDLYTYAASMDEVNDLLMRGNIKAAVIISHGFARDLASMDCMQVQVIIDGTEPQSGDFAVQHIMQQADAFVTQTLADQLAAAQLEWMGFIVSSRGSGPTSEFPRTTIYDHTGRTKGSSLNQLQAVLSVVDADVVMSSSDRNVDFTVVIGDNYTSCATSAWQAFPQPE